MLTAEQLGALTTVHAVDTAITTHRTRLGQLVGWLYPPIVAAEIRQLTQYRRTLMLAEAHTALAAYVEEQTADYYARLDLDGYVLPGTALEPS